jgi:Tol biopolymer transport system component
MVPGMSRAMRPTGLLAMILALASCGQAVSSAIRSQSAVPEPSVSIEPSPSVEPSTASSADPFAERMAGAEGIAFIRQDPADQFGQPFVVDDDGRVRQLIELDPEIHTGGAQSVKWSPDGEHVAFAYGPSITAGVGILHADGGDPLMIEGGYFAWSPDGSRLAEGGQLDVAPPGAMNSLPVSIVDPETGEAEEIGSGLLLGWHPDGQRVLVMRSLGASESTPGVIQLVLVSVADGSEQELIQGATLARWSPDGSLVAYVVEDNPCTGSACQRIVIGRGGSGELTEVGFGVEPVWSPDGSRLAYWALDETGSTVSVLDIASGQTAEYGAGSEFAAAWSPDGSRIAVSSYSDAIQQPTIRVIDVESGRIIVEFAGMAPSWRPNR